MSEEKMTLEQARKVLEDDQRERLAEQQERLSQCQAEIQPLLAQINVIAAKHKFRAMPRPFYTADGRTDAQFVLEPEPNAN